MGSAEQQGRLWTELAEKRQRYTDWMMPLWNKLLSDVSLPKDGRLLDAGCGDGSFGLCLKAHPAVKHVGIDASDEMIALAAQNWPNGEFVVGDLEDLPYPDQSFDGMIACNSIHFCETPQNAANQLYRVARSGGHVAIAVPQSPEKVEASLGMRVAQELLPETSKTNPLAMFRLAPEGAVEDLLKNAGFKNVRASEVPLRWAYSSADEYVNAMLTIGPIFSAVEEVGEAKYRAALTEALKPWVAEDGSVSLAANERSVCGTR